MRPDAPLSDPALIAGLDEDSNKIYMLVGELRALTEWDEKLLLRHLGCDPNGPRPNSHDAQQLRDHSVAYLAWVRDLCYLVDRSDDRHDVLHGAYGLCVAAGGDLEDRVERCRRAMEHAGRDGLSAHALIALGEVGTAWLQATSVLVPGPAQERAERVLELMAHRDAHSAHLHPRRLHWLYASQSDLEREIGLSVGQRMREHVLGCPHCEAIARQLKLLSERQSPPAS